MPVPPGIQNFFYSPARHVFWPVDTAISEGDWKDFLDSTFTLPPGDWTWNVERFSDVITGPTTIEYIRIQIVHSSGMVEMEVSTPMNKGISILMGALTNRYGVIELTVIGDEHPFSGPAAGWNVTGAYTTE